MTTNKLNNAYTIKASAPLLRPGLTIETTVSEGYATKGAEKMMEIVRAVNAPGSKA